MWIRISRNSLSCIIRHSVYICCPDVCYTTALYDVTLFRRRQPVMHKAGRNDTTNVRFEARRNMHQMHVTHESRIDFDSYLIRVASQTAPRISALALAFVSLVCASHKLRFNYRTTYHCDNIRIFYQKIPSFSLVRIISWRMIAPTEQNFHLSSKIQVWKEKLILDHYQSSNW